MYSDSDYIAADPFFGDEADLKLRSIKIRTARTHHKCFSLTGIQDHMINPGERYRYEKALVDGSFFGEYKICLKCMDEFISDTEGHDDDD